MVVPNDGTTAMLPNFEYMPGFKDVNGVPSVPSYQSLSIPVITRRIVSMYNMKIEYIEQIVKLSQGHLGQFYNFE